MKRKKNAVREIERDTVREMDKVNCYHKNYRPERMDEVEFWHLMEEEGSVLESGHHDVRVLVICRGSHVTRGHSFSPRRLVIVPETAKKNLNVMTYCGLLLL